MTETLLCIGTRKGLFVARSADRVHWDLSTPHFTNRFADTAVGAVGIDTRQGRVRVLVGADSAHWGPSVFHTDDYGATWEEATEQPVRFPPDAQASVERVWQIAPAGPEAPGVVYAGAEPASLWRSADGGVTFSLVEGLWNHPHRPTWMPGGGGLCLHTILTDARDPDRLIVAISTGGVYRSDDGGASWAPSNTGIAAEFIPGEAPEYGQCVHKVARDGADPDRLYLQNHGGVYRSDDAGDTWVSIAAGLPSDFGFAMAAHPRTGGTAWAFPLNSSADRVPANHRCHVYRTRDAGVSWQELGEGLPESAHHGTVLRDALCVDGGEPVGVYFGNRNGEVYASTDEGDTWVQVGAHLPDILCVRAATLD
ncbi:WD40/YVTN/BNR-like repeat-containing protein [Allonocardiopsis opalescens]|uniref:BNR/Asp-box repeat protein n=1 Tax=Allonocardiopsis opalescens TaxID=1144618 RepID=A0A2T0PTN6_9ACTN|nr:glycosyl hydrolase [Allonocardiopsis opalescens]PRX92263.1 hypothetical protein CLV72_11023 [Allonocardiopsis opalescens]